MKNYVKINLCIPVAYINKAKYIFSNFSLGWGLPIKFFINEKSIKSPHISYTTKTKKMNWNNTIIVPFNEKMYEKETRCGTALKDGFLLWTDAHDKINFDLIATTHRILNFLDEMQVKESERNSLGVFSTASLPMKRKHNS